MTVHFFTPDVTDILPSKKKVAFRAGHKALPAPGDPLFEPLRSAFLAGAGLLRPVGAWVTLSGYGGELPESFGNPGAVTLAAVTLGGDLDNAIATELDSRHTLAGVLLDAFGSEAAECLAEALDQHLRSGLGTGTRRFSPGYGDLSLLSNHAILKTLGVDFVHAHPGTGVMTPKKSVVFLMGWTSPPSGVFHE